MASVGAQLPNWPFEKYPIVYHDIDAEIPADHRAMVRKFYLICLCTFRLWRARTRVFSSHVFFPIAHFCAAYFIVIYAHSNFVFARLVSSIPGTWLCLLWNFICICGIVFATDVTITSGAAKFIWTRPFLFTVALKTIYSAAWKIIRRHHGSHLGRHLRGVGWHGRVDAVVSKPVLCASVRFQKS